MSRSVFLNNLDDFLAPSQACVNPLVAPKLSANASSVAENGQASKIVLSNDFSQSEFSMKPQQKPNLIRSGQAKNGESVKAIVSLNDCLACSGCVTTAEAVFIQEQSYDKLLQELWNNKNALGSGVTFPGGDDRLTSEEKVIAVVLSPNSVASIADQLGVSQWECFLRIAAALKRLGVSYVLDAASAGDVALVESREEFLARYRKGRLLRKWDKPATTIALSATRSQDTITGEVHDALAAVSVDTSRAAVDSVARGEVAGLPVLSSHCPGWVCFAEKTTPQALPYLSRVKSAQQIIGTLMKTVFYNDCCYAGSIGSQSNNNSSNNSKKRNSSGNSSSNIVDSVGNLDTEGAGARSGRRMFVVSIQPCFDKKLESSRKDFFHDDVSEFRSLLSSARDSLSRNSCSSSAGGDAVRDAVARDAASNSGHGGGVHSGEFNEVDLVLSTSELWQLLEAEADTWGASTPPPPPPLNPSSSSIAPANPLSSATSASTCTDTSTAVSYSEQEYMSVTHRYLLSLPIDPPAGRDEVEQMLRSFSVDGRELVSSVDANGGSGGYAEYIFRHAAKELYQVDLWEDPIDSSALSEKHPTRKPIPLVYTEGRNTDIAELDLHALLANHPKLLHTATASVSSSCSSSTQGPMKLKFGRAYGFRNIQSIMLKLKRGTLDLDFVEIMACPSGCNNGGGQLKTRKPLPAAAADAYGAKGSTASGAPETVEEVGEEIGAALEYRESPQDMKDRVGRVEAIFHGHGQLQVRTPDESPLVRYLYGRNGSTNRNASVSSNVCVESSRGIEAEAEELMCICQSEDTSQSAPLTDSRSIEEKKGKEGTDSSESELRSRALVPLSAATRNTLFHTQFHAVPKLETIAPLAAKW